MKVIATEKAPAAIGPYSQAYVNNGVLYTSGQLGINPETGNLGGDTIEEQAEWSCKNVGEILKAAGTDYEHVLKTTCFLVGWIQKIVFPIACRVSGHVYFVLVSPETAIGIDLVFCGIKKHTSLGFTSKFIQP